MLKHLTNLVTPVRAKALWPAQRLVQRGYTTYSSICSGTFGEPGFSVDFIDKSGAKISPWHHIPAYANEEKGHLNFVNEIPRMTPAKMEVCKETEYNPIVQDVKNGALRFYHIPLYWNYGCIPQTWEDPEHEHPDVPRALGDNDPLDVIEIGSKTLAMGEVATVKPLGILSMIDGGELDWKMIVICTDDPMADSLNSIDDIDPSIVGCIREWLRCYKMADGKPPNEFGHDEQALDRDYALKVVAETHRAWQSLMESSPNKIWTPQQ